MPGLLGCTWYAVVSTVPTSNGPRKNKWLTSDRVVDVKRLLTCVVSVGQQSCPIPQKSCFGDTSNLHTIFNVLNGANNTRGHHM